MFKRVHFIDGMLYEKTWYSLNLESNPETMILEPKTTPDGIVSCLNPVASGVTGMDTSGLLETKSNALSSSSSSDGTNGLYRIIVSLLVLPVKFSVLLFWSPLPASDDSSSSEFGSFSKWLEEAPMTNPVSLRHFKNTFGLLSDGAIGSRSGWLPLDRISFSVSLISEVPMYLSLFKS
ncbi:hypothetical protein WICPIJ_005144 [Wickerhamomyces pijperi]|uniref:Uncharacterized protein n=1 Tax=Wickerhamomyces pijperi TaxID=599730 RepID=A0A9P8TLE2_WICPI|nr:hypothetical protein WICPIJ_005144 [Wickerhamomyces pijperi]